MDDRIKGIQAELKTLVPRKAKRITESGQQVIREARDRLNQIAQLRADTK
jgi:DNA-binding transcriptional LysR family regulator